MVSYLNGPGAVSIGVPQGFILRPLLFAIALYVDDLLSVITHCYQDLCTDDVELHCSHSDLCVVETCLQSDLDAVAAWLCSSCLPLNVGKANCVLIGSHQEVANEPLHTSVDGNRLTQSYSV